MSDTPNQDSYMWNLEAGFHQRMTDFLEASGGRIEIVSGFRSEEKQQQLWDAALIKYGDPEIADNWVARPGKSNHGRGFAMDLSYLDDATKDWAHANATRFGLEFPMGWEPWHIEPQGLAGGTYEGMGEDVADRGAYTVFPGQANPADRDTRQQQYTDVIDRMFRKTPEATPEEPDELADLMSAQSAIVETVNEDEQEATDATG